MPVCESNEALCRKNVDRVREAELTLSFSGGPWRHWKKTVWAETELIVSWYLKCGKRGKYAKRYLSEKGALESIDKWPSPNIDFYEMWKGTPKWSIVFGMMIKNRLHNRYVEVLNAGYDFKQSHFEKLDGLSESGEFMFALNFVCANTHFVGDGKSTKGWNYGE